MRNLYTCSLAELEYADLDAFLGLSASDGLRPAEGPRLDYKSEVPRDLAKYVAGLANSQGGLIVLGVAESEGRPISAPGLASGRTDLKTQLTQIIASNIDPVPQYDIAVLPIPNSPGRSLAVVRVEESTWPPHFFTQTGAIPIRRQDQVLPASRQDLEDLIRGRGEGAARVGSTQPPTLPVHRRNATNDGKPDSQTFLKVWLRPKRQLNLRMDRSLEQKLAKMVRRVFEEADVSGRRGRDYFELVFDPDHFDYHRRWRIDSTGGFLFASQVQWAKSGPSSEGKVYLVNIAVDLLKALASAKLLFDHLGSGGRCQGGVAIAFADAPVVPTGHAGGYPLAGIGEIATEPSGIWSPDFLDIDSSELKSPVVIAANILCTQLREQRHADVDLEALEAAMTALARENDLLQTR